MLPLLSPTRCSRQPQCSPWPASTHQLGPSSEAGPVAVNSAANSCAGSSFWGKKSISPLCSYLQQKAARLCKQGHAWGDADFDSLQQHLLLQCPEGEFTAPYLLQDIACFKSPSLSQWSCLAPCPCWLLWASPASCGFAGALWFSSAPPSAGTTGPSPRCLSTAQGDLANYSLVSGL